MSETGQWSFLQGFCMTEDSQVWGPFVAQLRDLAVLRDLDPDQLPPHEEGWLLLPCSDGHRFRDMWNYHLEKCGRGPCHHPLSYLGGALALGDPLSPLAITKRGFRADEVLLDAIGDSLEFKHLRNIAAYTHFPCSAAGAAKLSPREQFDLFEKASIRLHKQFSQTRVVAFCHVHYPDNRFRTYFADIKLYGELRSTGRLDNITVQECA